MSYDQNIEQVWADHARGLEEVDAPTLAMAKASWLMGYHAAISELAATNGGSVAMALMKRRHKEVGVAIDQCTTVIVRAVVMDIAHGARTKRGEDDARQA